MRREQRTALLGGTHPIRKSCDNALHRQELARILRSMTGHLVGLTEIASMLGVTRQRAGQLVRDYDDFPPPVAELASGRVWETTAVETWAKAHPERPPGRRVKGHTS